MNLSGTIIRADWHMREAPTAPAAVSAQKQAEISESSVSLFWFMCPHTTAEIKS